VRTAGDIISNCHHTDTYVALQGIPEYTYSQNSWREEFWREERREECSVRTANETMLIISLRSAT